MFKMTQLTVGAGALAFIAFAAAQPAGAQVCTYRPGPDVIVGDLTGPSNYGQCCNPVYEALSIGTISCNLGNTPLDWIASNNQHPVIGGALYRLKEDPTGTWWMMEQVGQSWLKHGFFALQNNTCCSNCQADAQGDDLGPGCSDPYTSDRNGQQGGLGPKWQVDAHKGIFTYPPANPSWNGVTARRLEVAVADLEPTASTTTRYYGAAMYVTPDDANANNNDNNASYRRMTASLAGSAWTFNFTGATVRESPAIEAWLDSGVDPNVTMTPITVPGEGFLVLGASATDLGGGNWHYEYALYNMNSSNAIRRFEVPAAGVTASNLVFHDMPYRWGDGPGNVNYDGTDWTATNSGVVAWETVGNYDVGAGQISHNALRWDTTYNFRFDADAPPVNGDITLTTYKTETAFTVSGVPVPQGGAFGNAFCNGSDGAHAFCPCGNVGNPDAGCDNAAATGGAFMEATAFNPDGFGGGTATFTTTGLNPAGSPSYVLLRSETLGAPTAAFDGVLCLGGSVTRVGAGIAVAGTAVEPYVHGAMGMPGLNYYQLWYRSQPIMFCNPLEASNLSNGYDLTW